eukprot:1734608-Amphidinium_carterae.2
MQAMSLVYVQVCWYAAQRKCSLVSVRSTRTTLKATWQSCRKACCGCLPQSSDDLRFVEHVQVISTRKASQCLHTTSMLTWH